MSATPLIHIRTVPVLRSFDEAKAREFYVDFLGFTVEWEHRFEPGSRFTCRSAVQASCFTSRSIMATARPAHMSA